MNARSWFVLTAVCTFACASGCGSARWGSRHGKLRMPSSCVESSCDDPTCEICSPLPPLYDGMARNHRLNRRDHHGRGHGSRGHGGQGGCSCGMCGDGEWFEGEIIDGEGFGGCSSCTSCGDGMMMDGGMHSGMMSSGGCQTCQHQGMDSNPQMMPGQTYESQYEQQPTPAAPRSAAPAGSPAPPTGSSIPPEIMAPGQPMGQPTSVPMTSMHAPNYGAALFSAPPVEPKPYVPAATSTPVMHEQAYPMSEPAPMQLPAPPAPPLASPASHSAPMFIAPPTTSMMMPSLPSPTMTADAPPAEFNPPTSPIQLQSASMPAKTSAKKPLRPFSESAKPRPNPAVPQWEATVQRLP